MRYAARGALSAAEYAQRPFVLDWVLAAEIKTLLAQIAQDKRTPLGRPAISYFWGRPDDSVTPHGWKRCLKRNATARVFSVTVSAR